MRLRDERIGCTLFLICVLICVACFGRCEAKPTPAFTVPAETVPKQFPAPRWYTSLDAAREASQTTGKPAIVYWYGANCPPCRSFARHVLCDRGVRAILDLHFVCVKIDAERLNRTSAGKQQLSAWNIRSIPHVLLLAPDWKTAHRLEGKNDPRKFVEQLSAGQQRSSRQVRAHPVTRLSHRVPVRTANLQTAIVGPYSTGRDNAESTPLEFTDESWRPTTVRVQQVQYAPGAGYGSSGGMGGYRLAPINGGAYGPNGGGYWPGYGPVGGMPTYGGYYGQPAYYPPRAYYQPTYYGGPYGNPRAMVCGPWGCFLQ
jgi:hypothetical protein